MLLLSIFISVCIGFLVVFFLIRKMNIGNYSIFLKLFLGIGTGIGISSCIFFYYLIFFGFPTRPYYVSVEIGILLLLLLTSIRYNSLLYNCKFFRGSMDPVIGNKTLSMIKLFFAVALLLDIFTFIISSESSFCTVVFFNCFNSSLRSFNSAINSFFVLFWSLIKDILTWLY